MDNKLYWLWLQSKLGAAYAVKELFKYFSSPKELYGADEATIMACRFIKRRKKLAEAIIDKSTEDAEKILSDCRKYRIHILTPDDEEYPKALLDIENYPLVLYARGDIRALNNSFCISVIGTREPCVYGENAARTIVSGLVEHKNALIVSGGALGIDSISHRTAIDSGGKTVLVMGCGHGTKYLMSNSELRKSVSENGVLITEYPPLHPVEEKTFPQRNRIISAMSRGVVIIEAANKSGTFSTAKHAIKQGRDLFVLPGDIVSGNFDGSNQLLSEGARPVFSHMDILSYYFPGRYKREEILEKNGEAFPLIDVDSDFSKKSGHKRKDKPETVTDTEKNEEKKEILTKNIPDTISKNAEIVYNIMSDGVLTFDELEIKSDLETRKLLSALTELELEGLITADGPDRYIII